NERRENQCAGPLLADVGAAEGVHKTDDEATDDGPGNVADAAEHSGGERVEAVLKTHLIIDGLDGDPVDDAAETGESATDEESRADDAIDIDAHEPSRRRVLGGSPHRFAE